MWNVKSVLGFVCVVALAVSCSSGPKQAASESQPAATPAATDAKPDNVMTVAAGDFGVPECDSYMKKYLACIDSKVPEMARAPLKQALDQQKAAWKQAAATPQGKAALANGCAQAEAASKQSMAAYGCQW
ncbi:MAG TPA: hypothetical protein VMX54_19420 [Vicinamibacteria bacterium]|nr:hypothetical protein [Vicinamibacteria bacterium]